MESDTAALLNVVAMLGLVGMFGYMAYTIVSPMVEGDKVKKRMEVVAGARESLRQQRYAELEATAQLRQDGRGRMRDIVERFSLETLLASPDLREKLAQAGLRGQKPLYYFYIARMALPIGLGVLALFYAFVVKGSDLLLFQRFGIVVAATAFGYYFPSIWVTNLAKKRLASIVPVFPDALDLLLICVESGMSVEVAFTRVAEEMAEASIEIAEEFSLTTAELSYLNSRRQAYENLARRNNHEGIRSVATALAQAERYGTPLGATLRTLSAENRQIRVLQAEKKAAALPAKLTVPMMVFFMPVLFIVLLTPAGMQLGEIL